MKKTKSYPSTPTDARLMRQTPDQRGGTIVYQRHEMHYNGSVYIYDERVAESNPEKVKRLDKGDDYFLYTARH